MNYIASVISSCVLITACNGDKLDNPTLNKVTRLQAPVHEALTLVKNGKSEAVVIIQAPLGKNDKYQAKIYEINRKAAAELVKYIKAVTGAELTIQTSGTQIEKGKKIILIGESPLTFERGISTKDLPLEGFVVQTFPDGLAIAGRMPGKDENFNLGGGIYNIGESAAQGTLFGVYDFLERFCGIRWYYPGELGTVIPPSEDLIIPACKYSDWPEFAKRSGAHWMAVGMHDDVKSNAAGLKTFSSYFRAGDSSYIEFGCHSPADFGIHIDAAPGCFELSKTGKRDKDFPCYGNPKTIDLMFDDLVQFYENGNQNPYISPRSKRPWCEPTSGRIVVSPPDKPVACNCEYCSKLWRDDLGSNGQATEILAKFTGMFAEKIKAKWQGKKVLFLPYLNYLTCPENMKLPENVVPFICLTYGTANHKEPHVMEYSTRAINDWSKAVGNNKVIIWEYLCWPAENTFLPFQYPHIIKDFYLKNRGKLIGSFVDGHLSQGLKRSSTDMTPGGEWAYSHPTMYCWYRLMWNADYDVDAALDEYCTLMYGPSAPVMKKIMDILTVRWEKIEWKEKIKDHNVKSSQINAETMPEKQAKELEELLDKAEKLAAGNILVQKRIDFFGTALRKFLDESTRFYSNNIPEMLIKKVGENPIIDGKLNDRSWGRSEKYYLKNALEMQKLSEQPAGYVKAVWTDEGITFGFVNYEEFKSVADFKERDDRIYDDESIELFLQCRNDQPYFQVIVNCLGACYDSVGNDKSFNFDKIQVASYMDNKNKYWSCEIFLPFRELGITPVSNFEFSGNIARNRKCYYGNEILKRTYRWNTNYRANHNDTSAFGKMKLVE